MASATPSFLEQVRIIASTDLMRRIRDRSAIITAVIAPLALAVVFGSLFSSSSDVAFTVGIAAEDDPISEAIAADIVATEADGVVFIAADVDTIEALVRDDDLDSGVVLGTGLVAGGGEIGVIGNAERPVSADIARSVAVRTAATIDRMAVTRSAGSTLGVTVSDETATPEPFALSPSDVGGRSIDAMAYFGASMAMVLLFFTVGFVAHSIIVDKRTSVLDRLLAGPTSAGAILAGKAVSVSLTALAGFVVVWLVTGSVFGAEWGDPVPVVALIVATVAAIGGVATFVASFASTERQAETLTSVVTFGLAILGGNFTGPQNVPAVLDSVAAVIPNGVALRAFTEVSADEASVADLGTPLLKLALFALVLGGYGLARIRRSIAA